MSRIALGAVAAFTLCAAAPAFAQDSSPSTTQLNSRVVPYGDLNLDSRAGANTMLRRMSDASRFVCGDRSGPRTMQENGTVRACAGESMDNAVADLDHPNVTNRYYGNTPQVIIGDGEDGSGYAPDPYAYPEKGR